MNQGHPSLEKMSGENALSVFHQEGEYPTQATLRQSWLRLLKKYHEAGTIPNPERVTLINAARDVLRTCGEDVLPIANTFDAKTYVVWAWRGGYLVRGDTVESSPAQFAQIARAAMQQMSQGFRQPSAIFLQDIADKWTLWLIHAGGDIAPPGRFNNHGADDPYGDPILLRDLRQIFDRLPVPERARPSHSSSVDISALRDQIEQDVEPQPSKWKKMWRR
jgi:hypothetical protein